MCIFQLNTKSMQSTALFLKIGKWLWHFPQPRFQAVGLVIHACETDSVIVNWCQLFLYEELGRTAVLRKLRSDGHSSDGHLSEDTLVSIRKGEGDERRSEWVGKEKQSLQRGRNKWQHPRKDLLSICHMTMRVICSAVSLDQLEPKKAHGKLLKNWQLFLSEYKNSLWPQANNSLSCSWNNSYCALGPTLAASINSCAFSNSTQKACRAPHSFWKLGNGCDTSNSRAFSPV